jgi:hypothetical protein
VDVFRGILIILNILVLLKVRESFSNFRGFRVFIKCGFFLGILVILEVLSIFNHF